MGLKFIPLLYHDVVSDNDPDVSGFAGTAPAAYKLSVHEFHAHLEAVKRATERSGKSVYWGTDFENVKECPVLLTFDDGGVSAYTEIAPALEAYGWRGYFFVTTNFVGERGFMTKEQVIELSKRGHVIGSHSASHPTRFSDLTDQALLVEWQSSIDYLEKLLAKRVVIASVPGGFYAKRVARVASRAGIAHVFTSEPVRSTSNVDRATVFGRFAVNDGDRANVPEEIIMGKLSRRALSFGYWNMKKVAKNYMGPLYAIIRKNYLGNKYKK